MNYATRIQINISELKIDLYIVNLNTLADEIGLLETAKYTQIQRSSVSSLHFSNLIYVNAQGFESLSPKYFDWYNGNNGYITGSYFIDDNSTIGTTKLIIKRLKSIFQVSIMCRIQRKDGMMAHCHCELLCHHLTTSIIEQTCQPRPNRRSDGNS